MSAVDGKCEVYLDGEVRFGTDAFKALALGARAVFVGRPILWGLSYQVRLYYLLLTCHNDDLSIYIISFQGKEGVSKVLQILKDEFKLAMGLTGEVTTNLFRIIYLLLFLQFRIFL